MNVLKFPTVKKAVVVPREIFDDVYCDIIDQWQAYAAKNKLNEFIRNKISVPARGPVGADYVGDLNVLSDVERKLGMKVAVFYPDTTTQNPHGWLVGFHYDTEVYSAPPLMASEAYARALNILLYVGLEDQLKKLRGN